MTDLSSLYNGSTQLFNLGAGDLQSVAKQIAATVAQRFDFAICTILLLDEPILVNSQVGVTGMLATGNLVRMAQWGNAVHDAPDVLNTHGSGLAPAAVRSGKMVYASDVKADPRYLQIHPETKSELAAPLWVGDRIIGVLDLHSPFKGSFDQQAQHVVNSIAEQAGLALQNARLYDELCYHADELERRVVKHEQVEQTLSAVLNMVGEGIIAVDVAGTIVMANPETERVWGYPPEELVGQNLQLLLPEQYRQAVKVGLRRYVETAVANVLGQRIELESVKKNGTPFPLEMSVSETSIGDEILYTAAVRDITERKQAEEALRERTAELSAANALLSRALRAKDEFLANMSHELRTPLNAILGKCEILQEELYGPCNDKQQSALGVIDESGRHLLSLINDILDLAKIEAGKVALDIHPVSVQSVCRTSLQFIKQTAHKKGIKISFATDDNVQVLLADERRLKQILVNLLSNAVKFTPEGGRIGLKVEGDMAQEVVHFSIWDTGIGIAKEDTVSLFKPFMQVDNGLAREYEGTGLGLSLVYRLTEMHGGSVSVVSKEGQGSRFMASFPWKKRAEETAVAETQPEPKPVVKVTAHAHILLAEDNEINILTIRNYLLAKGYQVTVARNGDEAVERAKEEKPNLILMDVQMPKTDGLEATRRIRDDAQLANVPIIALTALAMPGDRDRCLAAGTNEYVSKPANLRQLVALMETLMGSNAVDEVTNP